MLLGANRFIEAGVPAPDREWYGREYERVADLILRKKISLPTLSDHDGAAVFQRLISTDNFSLSYNRTISITQRFPDFLTFQQSYNSILKVYANEANSGADLHKEVALLLAHTLRIIVVSLDLAEEYMPTIAHDEKFEIRMDGMSKMKASLPIAYSGVEESLGERKFYSEDDLSMLLTALGETTPKLKTVFTADFVAEARMRFAKRQKEFRKEQDLLLIDSIIKELQPSTPRP